MTTRKLFHKHFNLLWYYIFSNWYYMVLIFCRFTISYESLLLKEHVPRTQGINAWDMTVWSIMMFIKALLLHEIVHVNFFDRRNLNSECPGQ